MKSQEVAIRDEEVHTIREEVREEIIVKAPVTARQRDTRQHIEKGVDKPKGEARKEVTT